MPSTRILGCTVNVESAPTGKAVHGDILYTVSGEGAAALHQVCIRFACAPTELAGDTFTVKKSGLNDYANMGDTPTVTAIRERFRDVAPVAQIQ